VVYNLPTTLLQKSLDEKTTFVFRLGLFKII
jgi:hypothetical protein